MTGAAGGDRAPETAGRGALLDRWQRSFYRLHFQLAFRTKVAKEFEDWFCRLAGFALGADFERIRPYGAEGDHKADGRTRSDGTIYQCYALRARDRPRESRPGKDTGRLRRRPAALAGVSETLGLRAQRPRGFGGAGGQGVGRAQGIGRGDYR